MQSIYQIIIINNENLSSIRMCDIQTMKIWFLWIFIVFFSIIYVSIRMILCEKNLEIN